MKTQFNLIGIMAAGAVMWSCSSEEPTAIAKADENAQDAEVMVSVYDESATVSEEAAMLVAGNLFESQYPGSRATGEEASVSEIKGENGETAMYVVNYGSNGGFVIVSADKKFSPVLAYSETGHFDVEGLDYSAKKIWIDETLDAMATVGEIPDSIKVGIAAEWREMTTREVPIEAISRSTMDDDPLMTMASAIQIWQSEGYRVYRLSSINLWDYPVEIQNAINSLSTFPIGDYNVSQKDLSVLLVRSYTNGETRGNYLNTKWDDTYPYNAAIVDIAGTIGAGIGCVPLALGQIMKYHKYPTTYEWDKMPNTLPTNNTDMTLPNFLRQLGEACGINYRTDYTPIVNDSKAFAALQAYGYTGELGSYNSTTVTTSLRSARPVYISADNSNGYFRHAWVIDGYRSQSSGQECIVKAYSGDMAEINPTHAYYNAAYVSQPYGTVQSFHMIWGAGGTDDGWYSFSSSWSFANQGNYDLNKMMITQIKVK